MPHVHTIRLFGHRLPENHSYLVSEVLNTYQSLSSLIINWEFVLKPWLYGGVITQAIPISHPSLPGSLHLHTLNIKFRTGGSLPHDLYMQDLPENNLSQNAAELLITAALPNLHTLKVTLESHLQDMGTGIDWTTLLKIKRTIS